MQINYRKSKLEWNNLKMPMEQEKGTMRKQQTQTQEKEKNELKL